MRVAKPSGSGRRGGGVLGGRTAWLVLTVGQFAAVVAVLQRSSLGVAATDALTRFGITAATLGVFSMVQLLVYAGAQIPVASTMSRSSVLSIAAPELDARIRTATSLLGRTVIPTVDLLRVGLVL